MPDLYQGAEFWDLSLVDPDNRRPVDFAARRNSLEQPATPDQLLQSWHDGRIKQLVISRTLQARRRFPRLFTEGRYLPLSVSGEQAERLLAFARELDGQWLVVVVPRLAAGLLSDSRQPRIPAQRWGDTRIALPERWTVVSSSDFSTERQSHPNKPASRLRAFWTACRWPSCIRLRATGESQQ